MNITFLNGTTEQHDAVREALGDLLHLDTDTVFSFPWDIDFVPNPVSDPAVHHAFAVTELIPAHPVTHFRDDFPRFSPVDTYGSPASARQAVIHELGHAAEANLATDVQEMVAALFGATQATLYPTDRAWEDRPGEGMAETFKDAFLPQALRATPNSTNVKIPIPKYAELRRLFRSGTSLPAGFAPIFDRFDTNTLANYEWTNGSFFESSYVAWTPNEIDTLAAISFVTDLIHANTYIDGPRGFKWKTGPAGSGGTISPPELYVKHTGWLIPPHFNAVYLGINPFSAPQVWASNGSGGVLGGVTIIGSLSMSFNPNTEYWFRADMEGNDLTAAIYGADPDGGAVPLRSLTATLSGAAAAAYGDGVSGRPGIGLGFGAHGSPAVNSVASFDDFIIGATAQAGGTTPQPPVPAGSTSPGEARRGTRVRRRHLTGREV